MLGPSPYMGRLQSTGTTAPHAPRKEHWINGKRTKNSELSSFDAESFGKKWKTKESQLLDEELVLKGQLSASVRKKLIRQVQAACHSSGRPPKALAMDANCSVRTVSNFFAGKSLREGTFVRIVRAAGVEMSVGQAASSSSGATDAIHGLYSRELVRQYEGLYFAYRRYFLDPSNLLRSVFLLEWNLTKNCLCFKEFHTYHSPKHDRQVSYDQSGDVYISDSIGLVHLLTIDSGAIRLITVTKLHPDQKFMRGIVLTQSEWGGHYQPSTSPIYFRKASEGTEIEESIRHNGPINTTHPDFPDVSRVLAQTETEVARFATGLRTGNLQ